MTPPISMRGICKTFGKKVVLHDITLDIGSGEIYGLLGANGSGKSTLLRMIAGGLAPLSGDLQVTGSAGYVAQKFGLYEDLYVEENVAFAARCYGLSGARLRERVDTALDRMGLTEMRKERAGHLSHGWKQRLALAAALCHQPSILLLDEATAGIDPVARFEMWDIFAECAKSGVAIVLATHHMDEADRCDRIGYLNGGRLALSSTPVAVKTEAARASLGEALAVVMRRK